MSQPEPPAAFSGGAARKVVLSAILVVLILSGGGTGAYFLLRSPRKVELSSLGNIGYTVEIRQVEKGDYQQIILGFGTVQAIQTATISAEVSGKILEFDDSLRVGSEVTENQLLCRIDSSSYVETLRIRESGLDQAKGDLKRLEEEIGKAKERVDVMREDLELVKKEVTRQEALIEADVAAKQMVERARSAYQMSRRILLEMESQYNSRRWEIAGVQKLIESREAEVKLARLDLERCEIHAPFSGTIAARTVQPGEFISMGTPLIRLTDVSRVEIPIQVPASEVQVIALGSKVEAQMPQMTSLAWKGVVDRISPEIDVLNRTATVYIQVDNRELEYPLLPGQLVEAGIEGRLYPQKVVIPRRALIDGYAFVKIGDHAERRKPKVLRAIGDDLLIDAGIEQGEWLIVSNLEILYDGIKVATSEELNRWLQAENPSDGPAEEKSGSPPLPQVGH